jgi:hypothetical protein
MLVRASGFELSFGGKFGAAAENHHSNMVPTVRPRSQISDERRIVTADIFALL